MTMRYVCSWHYKSISKIIGTKETPRVSLLYGKSKPLSKKACLPWLLTFCCQNWQVGHKRKDCWSLPRQVRTVLQNSCFIEKSIEYFRPVSWRWMANFTEDTWVTIQAFSIISHIFWKSPASTSCLLS